MGKYLDALEIPLYCLMVTNVTDYEVNIAEVIVDSFINKDILAKSYVDTVTLNRKRKGKLKNHIDIEVLDVQGYARTPLGITKYPYAPTDILLDDYGYFEFIGNNTQLFGIPVVKVDIAYTSGYKEAPEDLKHAVAMIAQNITQSGSFAGAKDLGDLDVKVSFWDDSFVPSDIRRVIKKYKDMM